MAFDMDQFKPEQNDASIDYLRNIFGSIIDLVYQGNSGSATADSTIGSFMMVFGTGAFFLGMLFLIYSTIKGMIASAEDGRFLGKKASQVWLPIRTSIGAAIIFPAKNGFSLIQLIVIWIALQGAGMGTKSFVAILDFFKNTQMILQPVLPNARPLVLSIARAELCTAAMNKYFTETEEPTKVSFVSKDINHSNNIGFSGKTTTTPSVNSSGYGYSSSSSSSSSYSYQTTNSGTTKNVHYRQYSWRADGGDFKNEMLCGELEFQMGWQGTSANKNLESVKNTIYNAHAEGVNAIIEIVRPPISALVSNNTKPDPIFIQNAINKYTDIMTKAAMAAVNETNQKATTDFISYAQDGGWMYAGTWIGHINRMNDAVQQTLNDIPNTRSIPMNSRFDKTTLQTYNDYMTIMDQSAKSATDSLSLAYQNDAGTAGGDDGAISKVKEMISEIFMGFTRIAINSIAGDNLSHLTQMREFGDNLLVAAEAAMLGLGATAGAADSGVVSNTVGIAFSIPAALQSLSGLITTGLLSCFTLGLMLAVYIPMVPLIAWVMAILNWLLLVVEAVIAAPLFAAAHMSPHGDDEIGSAGEGYRMLTALAMRPSLMVIALVVSIVLQNSVAGYINAVFMPYTQAVQSGSMVGFVKFIGLIAVYTTMQLSLVHACNALIHLLPDRAMMWLGRSIAGLGGSERVESETKSAMQSFSGQAYTAGMNAIRANDAKNEGSSGANRSEGADTRDRSIKR